MPRRPQNGRDRTSSDEIGTWMAARDELVTRMSREGTWQPVFSVLLAEFAEALRMAAKRRCCLSAASHPGTWLCSSATAREARQRGREPPPGRARALTRCEYVASIHAVRYRATRAVESPAWALHHSYRACRATCRGRGRRFGLAHRRDLRLSSPT